jgi:hypothetical protein
MDAGRHGQATGRCGHQHRAEPDHRPDLPHRPPGGRREPYEAYAFDALLALAEAATGADGSAVTQTDSEASTDVAASKAAAEVAPDTGSSADGAQQPAFTPARRPPRRPDPRYLALLRVDLAALRRGALADGEFCEITGIGPVPVPVARNLLGESVLKLVITRGVDLAHITHLGRGPSAAQRIALAWTSPGCTVAGCPRTRIEYDHREPWARTRRTRLNQLDPLCEHHHDLKTRHRWALVAGHGKRAIVPPHDPRHPQRQRKLRPG